MRSPLTVSSFVTCEPIVTAISPLPRIVAAICGLYTIVYAPFIVLALPAETSSLQARGIFVEQRDGTNEAANARLGSSSSQPPDRQRLFKDARLEVWTRGWFSTGGTKHSHNASAQDPDLGNPTSTLDYQDLKSSIFELGAHLRHDRGWFVQGAFGIGGIDSGQLLDDDFLSAEGAAKAGSTVTGEHLFSRTSSEIQGDSSLWYLTMDLGNRLLTLESGVGGLDGFVGFQFWREHYEGFGVTQLVCTTPSLCFPPGTVAATGRQAISNSVQWSSLRLGLAADYQIDRVLFQLQAAFIPYTRLFSEDTHHFRSDLKRPSITMEGNGFGVEGEASIAFRVVSSLYLNVGYRYWYLNIYDGTSTHHFTNGDGTVPLTTFQTFRHGVTLGVSYVF